MSLLLRFCSPLGILLLTAGISSAATPKEIKAAIDKGKDALRALYAAKTIDNAISSIGQTALSGIAMLEAETRIDDPALKVVTEAVRTASYREVRTYEMSLCLLYLDRLGDPVDDALLQILAVRLMAGQTPQGGWTYTCIHPVGDEQQLRAIKSLDQAQPKFHPEVEKYYQKLMAARGQGNAPVMTRDDNSNTQFAVIALWLSRKHGVPVDPNLDAIEKRYMSSQGSSGLWGYPGPPEGTGQGMLETASPSMYCAGLIGLSTAIARREERRSKIDVPKKEEPKKEPVKELAKVPDDPFFALPPPPHVKNADPKKPAAPRFAPDDRDTAVGRAMAGLGQAINASANAGQGGLILRSDKHGHHDLYFYWSLERVCVIYGVEKFGSVDWYEAGASTLVAKQQANGTWGGSYGPDVDTSFAVLFLLRSNLARDLSGKMNNKLNTVMTTKPEGSGPNSTIPNSKLPAPGTNPSTTAVVPNAPIGPGSEAATLAFQLIKSNDKDWTTLIGKIRDSRGSNFTEALVLAANRLDTDPKKLKETRQALADRLTRMTPDTLRAMVKSDEPELRRGALIGMAQRDDKKFIPDLIEAITDDEEIVIRAAKAGLKSLTDQDFGPVNNASIGEKKLAKDAWQTWLDKQKK